MTGGSDRPVDLTKPDPSRTDGAPGEDGDPDLTTRSPGSPSGRDGDPALSAESVVAGYVAGVDVLTGCSVTVWPDEIVGIIGPNGAGKSTLVKALFGLVTVWSGRVLLHGTEITGQPAHRLVAAGVGYVPQVRNVFPRLTVDDNLRMGAYRNPTEVTTRRDEVFELFPRLAERRRQRAGLLSGGERQMLAMARALMTGPSVLLLDEPSAGLSPAMQDDVFEQVTVVNRAGAAVVMVEQNARRCLEIADRGYVLDQGRNAHEGPGRALLDDPKVVELYLGRLVG